MVATVIPLLCKVTCMYVWEFGNEAMSLGMRLWEFRNEAMRVWE